MKKECPSRRLSLWITWGLIAGLTTGVSLRGEPSPRPNGQSAETLDTPSYRSPYSAIDEEDAEAHAVVRRKHFKKSGHIEVGPTAGFTPYSNLVSSVLVGGRLSWHLSDALGWEVLDFQYAQSTVTQDAKTLTQNIKASSLQAPVLQWLVGTHIVISPFYGKLHLWKNTVLHFDFYTIVGGGLQSVQTAILSSGGGAATLNQGSSSLSPMGDIGIGFKVFLGSSFAILVDFRDYVSYIPLYQTHGLQSNFIFSGGLSWFLPSLGS